MMKSDGSEPVCPDAREYVRLGALTVLLAAAAIGGFACGWWVLGVIATVLAVVLVGGCCAIGFGLATFVLAPRLARSGEAGKAGTSSCKSGARVDLGSVLFAPRDPAAHAAARADLAARGIDPADPAERRRDRAVGPLLALEPPADDAFSKGLGPGRREALRARRLEERALTLAWLDDEGVPDWQLVKLRAEDGAVLAGHVLEAHPQSGRWVLLAHGYRGTWREMIQYARRWSQAGYNLLLIEQRAQGRSGGKLIGLGWLERRDLATWCRWLANKRIGDAPDARIVLHGHSMGAAAACMASSEPDLPACVSAAVCDCAFESAWSALAWIMGEVGMPARPVLDLLRLAVRLKRGGYDLADADALRALAKQGLPMLFVQGAQDPIVPASMAHALEGAARATRRCGLLMVEGAGHCQAVLADGDAYFDRVLGFVDGAAAVQSEPLSPA